VGTVKLIACQVLAKPKIQISNSPRPIVNNKYIQIERGRLLLSSLYLIQTLRDLTMQDDILNAFVKIFMSFQTSTLRPFGIATKIRKAYD